MDGDGADIYELKPRDGAPYIEDRWGRVEPEVARREQERINRETMKRVLATETGFSLSALERAAMDIERGRRLLAIAELADDVDREEELAAALDLVAAATGPRDWID